MPFREAVKELAVSAGMTLPEALKTSDKEIASAIQTAPLFETMEIASKFFKHVLRHDQDALNYLKKRGINQQSVKKFNIGATPNEWRSLSEAFPEYDTNPLLSQTGLVRDKESENGRSSRYDTFRDRIMFPVRDTRSRIIAFGGRLMGEGDGIAKYMNSPESPIFNKSDCLYGLYEAREAIRQKKIAIVVEGYIDVVMLSQAGIENVVASLGTSMTRSHVQRLLTQAESIAFAFDGDAAGRKAAWRAMENCMPYLEDQHDVRFLILPEGKDPDDLAQEEGAKAFDNRVLKAPALSEFLIRELSLKHNNLSTAEDRARFAFEGTQVANKINFKTKIRNILLQRISEESKVPGSALKTMQRASNARKGLKTVWSTLTEAALSAPGIARLEKDLLLELLDMDDDQEVEFANTIQSIPEQDHPEKINDPRWLLARDTMLSAVDLISEHRQKQIRSELRDQFQKGEITESEYMRISMQA